MANRIPCPNCGMLFDNPSEAMKHAESAHGMSVPSPAPPAQYSCTACGAAFSSREALELHGREAHGMRARDNPARSLRAGPLLGWGALGGSWEG